MTRITPAPAPDHLTRIHFWNTAGSQSIVVPTREACTTRDCLLASDCVIYFSESVPLASAPA